MTGPPTDAARATEVTTDASLLDLPSAESEYRTVNGVELHVVTAGDPDDPLVVMLHGFPEFWYGWRRQIPALVDAGYRVVVPDQRGYNLSEKPTGLDPYRIDHLADDIVALSKSEDRESAHIVGHDWGAAVAWQLALASPEVIDRLTIMNVPHPVALNGRLKSDPRQILRSWYAVFFQLPRLPEWVLIRDDHAGLETALDSGQPGTFSETDLQRYRAAWRQPGAITGMLNWYRAALRRAVKPPAEMVSPPTMVVWGLDDPALVPQLAVESAGYCENGRLERFPGVTHWVQHEAADEVNELLLDHLGSE
jgi:pimeloyl-ACP methyl ester carboxylesterase